ncbi:MAG: YqgE/AlgH family protein [Desulfobacteraceae bacterium]
MILGPIAGFETVSKTIIGGSFKEEFVYMRVLFDYSGHIHSNKISDSIGDRYMNLTTFSSLKGHFLMAMPSLSDPNFEHSVTCISEHTTDGAFGIVINRLFEGLNAKVIFDELAIEYNEHAKKIPVHIGGPVHTNELFVLHGAPFHGDGLLMVNDGLALDNSRRVLEDIAAGRGPKQYIIALGCAGWGGGQLEWEMKQNAWLTIPCVPDILFELPVEDRWESAIKRLGIDPDLLSGEAGNA